MKPFMLTCLLLLTFFAGFSQFKNIAQGPSFEEPEKGFAKLLLMKNGNTAFLHIDKEGIEVKLYDAQHKEKAVKVVAPHYNRSREKNIESVFEIGGNIVLMVSEIDERTPVLFRIIIDGNTGELIDDAKIAELNRLTFGQGYAMAFGRVAPPDFFVRKDSHSDYYAVVMLNSFEKDPSKRMEIVWYGPDHKEVNRAYYLSPDNKYKYLNYVDMTVIGGDQVSVLAYAYNTVAHGGKESELVIANLKAGAKEVSLNELDFSKDLVINSGLTRYNPVTKQILLIAAAQKGKKTNEFFTVMALVDPFADQVVTYQPIYAQKANAESIQLFGSKHGFTGVPQNLFVNADGSFTVVYEEVANYVNTSSSGGSTLDVELGNIAVTQYDPKGEELGSYLVPKKHWLADINLFPFYHSAREGSATKLQLGNQFKSFAYLNGVTNSYILFNDLEKNGEEVKKGEVKRIMGVGECDGFYFPLNGTDMMPERQFVFGKPDKRREHDLALFAISDFDRDRNVYVTLQLDKEGRSKEVKVVWLQPN